MIKKTLFSAVLALSLVFTGCGPLIGNTNNTSNNSGLGSVLGSVLGGMIGGNSGGGLLGGVLGSVISNGMGLGYVDNVVGHSNIDKSVLAGTWIYAQPGCAFASQNQLTQSGGNSVATQVNQKLASAFNTMGIKSENTGFAFDQQGNFEAVIKGVPMKGTYTFDPSSGKLNLKSNVGTIPAFLTPTAKGLALTLETKNLTGVLQSLIKPSSNAIAAITSLGNSYSGVRMGFDLVKYQQ